MTTQPSSKKKVRLDELVFERFQLNSKAKAQALIRLGQVFVENQKADKPGKIVASDANLTLKENLPYVSRGGLKLKAALAKFKPNIKDAICADIGASTGGFTDCLLQHGVKKVYAIDVGYGQLDYQLRQNPKVIVFEKTNFRYFDAEQISDVDLFTIDVSFISLKIILTKINELIFNQTIKAKFAIGLFKPQFEVGPKHLKKGILKDPTILKQALQEMHYFCEKNKIKVLDQTLSPIKGQKGNQEFLLYLKLPKK